MEEHGVTQTEHMATIEAHAVAQQVQQVHVATYTEHSMLSADEDSPSSPEDTSYDDSDILNSTAADEVTAHLAAAGNIWTGNFFFLLYLWYHSYLKDLGSRQALSHLSSSQFFF